MTGPGGLGQIGGRGGVEGGGELADVGDRFLDRLAMPAALGSLERAGKHVAEVLGAF